MPDLLHNRLGCWKDWAALPVQGAMETTCVGEQAVLVQMQPLLSSQQPQKGPDARLAAEVSFEGFLYALSRVQPSLCNTDAHRLTIFLVDTVQ
jgi:hypothetical protein